MRCEIFGWLGQCGSAIADGAGGADPAGTPGVAEATESSVRPRTAWPVDNGPSLDELFGGRDEYAAKGAAHPLRTTVRRTRSTLPHRSINTSGYDSRSACNAARYLVSRH
jgi:hypothetical protein